MVVESLMIFFIVYWLIKININIGMAYNISNKKFKIYIDPEKNYKNSINKIIRIIKI